MQKKLLAAYALFGFISFGVGAQTDRAALQEVNSIAQADATKLLPPAPIWGAGAAVGNSDGQFANAFVQTGTYTPGTNPAAWTALSINDTDGGRVPGNAYWTRSLTGLSQGAYAGNTPASSPSQMNGVAIFDSDFLDTSGVVGAFGTGISPSPHRGALISPRIDLTGYTDAALLVNLYSYYREFAIQELSVSMSTDDGATWSSPVDYRQFIGSNLQGFVDVPFNSITAGIANLSQSRVKLTFSGDFYFAMVDDLSIRRAPDYDLALGVVNPDGGDNLSRGNVVQITGNRYFPISQLARDQRHFAFGGNIRNFGALSLAPSARPVLRVEIEKNSGGTWIPAFTDSELVTEAIPAGGFVWVGDAITDYSWVQVGDYRAIYTVSFDGEDGDPANNSLTHFFSITPDNYASLVSLNASGQPAATSSAIPAGEWESVEYGSVFYFDAATSSNLKLTSVSFRYYLRQNFSPLRFGEDQNLRVRVYSVDAGDGETIDRGTLNLVGICDLPLTGLGTAIPPGQYGVAACSPVDINTGQSPFSLTTGHYFIAVEIRPGTSIPFTPNDIPLFAVSNEKNYHHNNALTLPGKMIRVSPIAITQLNGGETWFSGGFGANIVPSIGIGLSGSATPLDSIFSSGFETVP